MLCMMSHLLALCHVETTELFTAAVTLPYRVFFDIACGVDLNGPCSMSTRPGAPPSIVLVNHPYRNIDCWPK